MADDPLRAALSGGALRDMTTRADADPALWAEIFDANRDEVQAAGEELVATLGQRGSRGLIEVLRWQPREYFAGEGNWQDLLLLGRQGAYVRKVRVQGTSYSFEHANMRSCQPKEDPTPASGAP
jgi:hypothetical protein